MFATEEEAEKWDPDDPPWGQWTDAQLRRFQDGAWAEGLERGKLVDNDDIEIFRASKEYERDMAATMALRAFGPPRTPTPEGARTPGGEHYRDPSDVKDELHASLQAYSKEQHNRLARMSNRHHHRKWENLNLAMGLDLRARKLALDHLGIPSSDQGERTKGWKVLTSIGRLALILI